MRTLLYIIIPALLLAGCGTESEPTPTYELSTSIEPANSGTVVYAEKPEYKEGETVELTAKASEGWSFLKWQGDAFGDENPESITMDRNKTVSAVFEEMVFEMWECGTICDVTDPKAEQIHLPWGNSMYHWEKEDLYEKPTLNQYFIRILGGSFTIVDVSAESDNPGDTVWWDGLEEDMVLESGDHHIFSINAEKSNETSSDLTFSFRVKETDLTFTAFVFF